jgi:hypothetical protein
MRSLFTGIFMLSASMAVVGAAQAQTHLQTPPGYGSMQAPIGHRQPTRGDLRPTQDDLQKIDSDNQLLNQPASQDDVTGAGQIPSGEDALTRRVEQDNPRLDGEITDICPSCGDANAPPIHRWSPIYNGFNHQPTRAELRALHLREFTPAQAQETDRLYDQLMSDTNQMLGRHPAGTP